MKNVFKLFYLTISEGTCGTFKRKLNGPGVLKPLLGLNWVRQWTLETLKTEAKAYYVRENTW